MHGGIHRVPTAGIAIISDGNKELTLAGDGFSYGDFNKAGNDLYTANTGVLNLIPVGVNRGPHPQVLTLHV